MSTQESASAMQRYSTDDGERSNLGRVLRSAARWLTIALMMGCFGFPLYWTLTMSFKPPDEWNPPGTVFWWPEVWTTSNFKDVLGLTTGTDIFATRTKSAVQPIINSVIAAGLGTLLALVVGVLASYGIARFRAGGRMLPFQILQLRMFPPIAIIIPLLFMWVYLGLWDTALGLIIIYAGVTFPFAVWLMRSFFQEVPREIGEAAIVDGCTQWGAFFKVVLPQAKGGLAATALFIFILNWSDFLIALVMTQDNMKTAPVYLQSLQGGALGQEYGRQAALAMILILPPAILGLMIQKYLVRGLTFGAIKR
ncbi:MAG: carbohydrate ABC transporter permease [Gaiella sp.]